MKTCVRLEDEKISRIVNNELSKIYIAPSGILVKITEAGSFSVSLDEKTKSNLKLLSDVTTVS